MRKTKRYLTAALILVLLVGLGSIGTTLARYVSLFEIGSFSLRITPRDTEAPVLTITDPADQGLTEDAPILLSDDTYLFAGTATDNSGTVTVTVDGMAVTTDPDGNWQASVDLDGSKTTAVTVVAADGAGNTATAVRYFRVQPILAAEDSWYTQGAAGLARASITVIEIVDTYTVTGSEAASWDASAGQTGSVMAHILGTKLILAGNGSGYISANPNSRLAFSGAGTDDFSALAEITGLHLLRTNAVWTMEAMFENCHSLCGVNVSGFSSSGVTLFTNMFRNCSSLAEITGLDRMDTAKGTSFGGMFAGCASLRTLDLSGMDTGNACDATTDGTGRMAMQDMFLYMTVLEQITIGESYRFYGNGTTTEPAVLPTPSAEHIPGSTGVWYRASDGAEFAPDEVPDGSAETFTALPPEEKGEA